MHQPIVTRCIRALIASLALIPGTSLPNEGPSSGKVHTHQVTDDASQTWAFEKLRRPTVPGSIPDAWSNNPIDRFVFDKLQQHGLRPNPPATRRELVRRAFFDLIGLPPSPEEVESFEHDQSPDSFHRLIDSLLARAAYGERWGRHWLDVVRYAQTNGYERDGEKPNAWKYRDYVIKAFNEDKPYDQFVLEQLAGDELDPISDDALIATGFYRLGVWDDEPDDARMAEFESLDDVMIATSATFLGLTIACARCHDHKFDPIPQGITTNFSLFSAISGPMRTQRRLTIRPRSLHSATAPRSRNASIKRKNERKL